MFGYGRATDPELLRYGIEVEALLRQEADDLPARGICNGLEYVASHCVTGWLQKYRKPNGYANFSAVSSAQVRPGNGSWATKRTQIIIRCKFPVNTNLQQGIWIQNSSNFIFRFGAAWISC
jgi:hypothetical protein